MRWLRSGLVLGLVGIMACAWGAAGTADTIGDVSADAPGWHPPVTLSSRGAGLPDVAVDRAGNTTVVWQFGSRIEAVRRPAGGRWRDPVTIGRGGSPMVGADARGNVTVVWSGRQVLLAARRPVGGQWRRPVPIAFEGRYGPSTPSEMAVSSRGAVVVVWSVPTPRRDRVIAAYRPAGGRWRAPAVAGSLGDVNHVQVAIDAGGRPLVVFSGLSSTGLYRIAAAERAPGRGWLPQVTVFTGRPGEQEDWPDVAVDRRGNATTVWWHMVETADEWLEAVRASRRLAGQPWESPVELSTEPGGVAPAVVMDRSGRSTAAWYQRDGQLRSASRTLPGAWQPAVTVGGPGGGQPEDVRLVANPRGALLFSWQRYSSSGGRTEVAYRPSGGPWGPPTLLNAGAFPPEMAVHWDGDAITTWLRSPGQHMPVRARSMTAQ